MKENKILISILVPTYNRVKYLEECLNSIVEQEGFDLRELELIVSDNSEGDETKSFMNNYIKKHKDWNIKYNKNEKNLGMVGNWNKLLELKKGEYFIFLSDDDKFYGINSLSVLYNAIVHYNCDACRGLRKDIDENNEIVNNCDCDYKKIKNNIHEYSFDDQLLFHTISFGGVLYKDFKFVYEEGANYSADWTFNLQYLYNSKKILLVNTFTFLYRQHRNQLSNTSMNIKTQWKSILFNYNYFKIGIYKRIIFLLKVFLNAILWRLKKIKELFLKHLHTI